jgi:hypothetical protein
LSAPEWWKMSVNAAVYKRMMKKRPNPYPPDDPQQRVLEAIGRGRRTWEEIAAATGLSDRQLGLIFSDLLVHKKVKTLHREGVRVYLLL